MGNLFSRNRKPIVYPSEVELAHFKLLRSIGKGAFGKVRVVEKRDTRKLFALKYINKARCIRQRAVHNTLRERFILQEIQHPFVVNLRYAFQDDENMFVVLDLMTGGSLRYHLDRLRCLAENQVRFIAAEIVVALQYLHGKRIVHRDIKPDNILIDDAGHMHLTDFNIAARLEEGKYLTSQSGTLSYMAPEMFTKKGYGTAVDYWALGVVMYECIYGTLPFRQESEEAVIKDITSGEIVLKSHGGGEKKAPVSAECIKCIEGFMTRDKHQRFGCKGGKDVSADPFFASIPFAELEKKQVTAPFIPDPKSMNFDPTHELEELLLEENPLMVKPRKRKTKRLLADYSENGSRPCTAPCEASLPSPPSAPAGVTPATTANSTSTSGALPSPIANATAASIGATAESNPGSPVRLFKSQNEAFSRSHSFASAHEANRVKKGKKEEEPLSAEMQLIEDAFIPFDFEKRAIYLRIAEDIFLECGSTFPANVSNEMNTMIAREKKACAQIAAEAAAVEAAKPSPEAVKSITDAAPIPTDSAVASPPSFVPTESSVMPASLPKEATLETKSEDDTVTPPSAEQPSEKEAPVQ